jgi:hypothetical protein
MRLFKMKTITTEHLSVAAYRPTKLANLLAFPEGSYLHPRTEEIKDNPYARKLLFSKFELESQIHEIKDKMQQHKIYDGFDIDVRMNSHRTLEITLIMKNKGTTISSIEQAANSEKQEYYAVRSIVKKVVGGKVHTHFKQFSGKNIDGGYEFTFIDYILPRHCGKLSKDIERQMSNYTVTSLLNGIGLIITCMKDDTATLNIPYGLKEIEKPIIVEPVTEVVVEEAMAEDVVVEEFFAHEVVIETPTFKQQIINSIQGLMAKGLSLQTIKSVLNCSDAEMLELMDINSTVVSFDVIERLTKLSNTKFIIE